MNCILRLQRFGLIGERRRESRSFKQIISRGSKIAWPAAVIVIGFATPSYAQVIPSNNEVVAPPWNGQRVFEPTTLPDLTDPIDREEVQPEDMPVKNRQQPGYEPVGVRAGSWMFNPSLMVGGFFDSNVFSSNTTKRSDLASVIQPSLRAHTLWDRNGIDLRFSAQNTTYAQTPSLNQTNASLKGNAWLDVSPGLSVLTDFQIAHLNESVGTISSPVNAVEPTPYNLYAGNVSIRKEFNRFATSIGVRAESYDYSSTRAQNGSVINQDGRDGQVYGLHGRIDYAFSPYLGWYAAAEGNQRNVRGTPLQPLNSQGYQALSGFTVGLTHLISGEFGAGYARQEFDDAAIGTIEGPSYRAMLTWSPTPLIDVHLRAEQIITETSDTSSNGVRANALQLGVDYELRRNVVVSLTGGYEDERFFGQPRKDKVITADSRIKYLMNRYYAVSLFHRFTERNSDISAFSYDKHLVGINVTKQF